MWFQHWCSSVSQDMLVWQLFGIDAFVGWKRFVYGWFNEFNSSERTFDSQKMQKKTRLSEKVYTEGCR